MVIPNPDLASSLRQFLDDFARLQPSQIDQIKTEASPTDSNLAIPNPDLASALRQFLDDLARLQPFLIGQTKKEAAPPDSNLLLNLLSSMCDPLYEVQKNAWNFDPWEVAGLGRNEVRNTSVLAWLLNPRGSHGMGSAVLQGLLSYINRQKSYFPDSEGNFCNVRTEICRNGELSDRLDIEIDAATFYLIIEAKIGASEGFEQLNRYGRLAETQKAHRHWALIYLTPGKKEAKTGGNYTNNIISISWEDIARIIEKAIPKPPETPSQSWYAANHAVTLFAKHIRNH